MSYSGQVWQETRPASRRRGNKTNVFFWAGPSTSDFVDDGKATLWQINGKATLWRIN
jgi:hypothetical protein